MIGRYNPHQIQKEVASLPTDSESPAEFLADLRFRADQAWKGAIRWVPPTQSLTDISAENFREYGIDCVRLAFLTASNRCPDATLLESSHRWLALTYSQLTTPAREAASMSWNPDPWLWAAYTSRDHLMNRSKPYPALAAVRKALKRSPLSSDLPFAAKALALALLFPFAPCLAVHFLRETLPLPGIPVLAAAFLPRAAVRIFLEKSGCQWEVVDILELEKNPRACLGAIPWVEKSLSRQPWNLESVPDGWKIFLNRQNSKNNNLFS